MANPWATTSQALEAWPEASRVESDRLQTLLDVAYDVLSTGPAPALEDGDPVPARYTEATILHAREVWAAIRRDGDVIGFDAYAVRARPVTSAVLSLLRPPTVPVVG